MEVVSTSNLVSSETKKTTTACNFQTIAMNSFVVPHDLMRGQIGWKRDRGLDMHICKYEGFVVSWWQNCEKHPKKYIYRKQQNQNPPAISWKKKFGLLWKYIIFCNNLIRAKEDW